MSLSPAHGFDYTPINVAVAGEMRAAAGRICERTRAAVLETGRDLLAIKNRIEHGQFVRWVEAECQFGIRAAQRAMAAAEVVEKNDKLSYLPVHGLLALAAPTSPAPMVEEIISRIDAGERPSAAEIRDRIDDARWKINDDIRSRQGQGRRRGQRRPITPEGRPRREREIDNRTEKAERRWAESRAATKAVVALLLECLGNRRDDLTRLLDRGADLHEVGRAIRAAAVS